MIGPSLSHFFQGGLVDSESVHNLNKHYYSVDLLFVKIKYKF